MRTRLLSACCAAALLALVLTACSKGNAGSQDQAITTAVQSKLSADPALQGAGVNATALNGVVTLTGTVNNDAARTAAAADAQVPGVTQVNNQIATNTPAHPAAGAVAPNNAMMAMQPAAKRAARARSNAAAAPAPVPAMQAAAPVEIEPGTALHIRLGRALSSATASAGEGFTATMASPVLVNGQIAIPQGAAVSGTIAAADSAGHFKGQSRLVLKLTSLQYNGQSYDLATQSLTRLASSRTTRSAETIGGGAAVGALIGALVGHGKGAAIGAAAGAGTGTAAQALTKPAEVNLPAEAPLSFTLTAPLQVVPAASVH
ncbi:MAG TPA: BON domain-containing protein [Terriglobales bacterium]|nr:BON domain-containing protein [Terriglobales bacterium]